jgi:signal transduction histidine kinase
LLGNDEARRVLVSARLNEGSSSKDHTFHFLVKDIEQQRIHQEQMAQADKLASIGQLSSGIAHEINNPLGIIQGYTQLLMRNSVKETAQYNDLKIIEKHVKGCKSIVENLLNFSRPSETVKSLVFLDEMITEQIEFVQHHADMKDIQMTTDFNPNVPPIFMDEKKIRQVLMNLIMNAKHAVGDQGIIHLTTGYNPHTRKAVIRITDTGHGIEKKNVSKIFDPFFTTKPPGEGTGLGLSVSYGIVKSHGGDIFVRSTPGKGASFTVVLPVKENKKGLLK